MRIAESDAVLIAIEGIDGSGKGTQAKRLVQALSDRGQKVELLSFPRYSDTFFGRAVGRFLNGEFGSLSEANPYLVSLLFAGDRFESRELLQQAISANDVVVLDRYLASNIAHQGAKLPRDQRAGLVEFVEQLELSVYGLPPADLTILLDLPAETAQELIAKKNARDYTEKTHDLQEADGDYLSEVRGMYRQLAESADGWSRVDCLAEGNLKSIEAVSKEILNLALQAAES